MTNLTLKLEANTGSIVEIIQDGLRIAKLLGVEVELVINGVDVFIHPLYSVEEVYESYMGREA